MSRPPNRDARYDVLVAGGEVVDPGAGLTGQYDVAISGGRIASVAPHIDRSLADEVVDAAGLIVTPGLIDLHTHIYWGVTYWGIEADPVAAKTGVTTWLDVGSAGSYSFPGFREYIVNRNRVRTFALLNTSSIGLIAPSWEFANPDYWDIGLAETIVNANRDIILGIKARIDGSTTRGVGIRPLHKARELADRVDLPLMVHIGVGPPSVDEVLALMRPGDILTHCFTGGDMRILGADGVVNQAARALQQEGVILDVGHGTGSFSYEVAEAFFAQGILPDVISSDIHQTARQGPMFDLPTTLSKFLSLGMTLPDVIERATSRPAQAMRRPDLGSLQVGSVADLAVFELVEGDFTFHDVRMVPRAGKQRLVNRLTLVDGERLPDVPEREMHIWATLPAHQQVPENRY